MRVLVLKRQAGEWEVCGVWGVLAVMRRMRIMENRQFCSPRAPREAPFCCSRTTSLTEARAWGRT